MNIFQTNFQTNLYNQFISKLNEICNFEYSYTVNKITDDGLVRSIPKKIKFKISNADVVERTVRVANILNGKKTVGLDFEVFLADIESEKVNSIILPNLIEIPIMTRDGLFIGGEQKTFTNVLDVAKGWQYEVVDNKKSVKERYNLEEEDTTIGTHMLFRPERGRSLTFTEDNTGQFKKYVVKNLTNNNKVLVGEFLVALLNREWETVRSMIAKESNSLELVMPSMKTMITKQREESEFSVETCKLKVLKMIDSNLNLDNLDIETEFNRCVLNNNFYKLNESNLRRVKRFFSFYNRCRNLILANPIQLNGRIINKGTYLVPELLEEIDNSNVTELHVFKNSRDYKIVKLPISNFLDGNSVINAMNILVCELDGLGTIKDIDDIENKTCTNAYTFLRDYVENCLVKASNMISKRDSLDFDTVKHGNNRSIEVLHFDFVEDVKSQQKVPALVSLALRNSVSATAQHYKLTSSVKNPTDSQREIKDSSLGYICSQGSPESEKTGITQNLSACTFSNSDGELCNYYYKLENGKPVGEPVILSVYEAQRHSIISELPKDDTNLVRAWKYCEIMNMPLKSVEYVRIAPETISSRWAMMGPLFNHDKERRIQMKGNHMDQVKPTLGGRFANITSGISNTFDEYCIRCNEIVDLICILNQKHPKQEYYSEGIELIEITRSNDILIVTFKSKSSELKQTLTRSVPYLTTVNQLVWSMELNTSLRDELWWKDDEIVIKPMDIDTHPKNINPVSSFDFGLINPNDMKHMIQEKDVALGRSCNVVVSSFKCGAYEDSVGVRRGFVEENHFSNVFTHKEELELTSNKYMEVRLFNHSNNRNLKSDGTPYINKFYNDGETIAEYLIIKRDSKTGKGSTTTKIIRQTLEVKTGYAGYVQDVQEKHKGDKLVLVITLGGINFLEIADKITGHHGNKGTIGRIIPDEEMICLADGTPADFFVNPLGIPSRMNIAQIMELLTSKLLRDENDVIVMPPFDNSSDMSILHQAQIADSKFGYVDIYDPKHLRKYPNKASFGKMYIVKLDHSVAKKINGMADPVTVNSKTGQPTKSAHSSGAQSISELNLNAHIGNGCYKSIDFDYAGGSDDLSMNDAIKVDLMSRGKTERFGSNNTYQLQHALIRVLGYDVLGSNKSGINIRLLTHDRIKEIIKSEQSLSIDVNSLLYDLQIYKSRKGLDREAYVGVNCGDVAWVNPAALSEHLVNIIPVYNTQNKLVFLSRESIKSILRGDLYLKVVVDPEDDTRYLSLATPNSIKDILRYSSEPEFLTGGIAILRAFSLLNKSSCIHMIDIMLEGLLQKEAVSSLTDKEEKYKIKLMSIKSTYEYIPEFKELITNTFLLTPLATRPKSEAINVTDSMNIIYKQLLNYLRQIRTNIDMLNEGYKVNICDAATMKKYNNFYKFFYEVCTKDEIERYRDKPQIKSPLHLIKDKDVGISRGALLSKKIKYSCRSTIIGVTDLPINYTRIPRIIAYEVFKYHMVHWLKVAPETTEIFKEQPSYIILEIIKDLRFNHLEEICKRFQVTWQEARKIYNNVYSVTNRYLENELVKLTREPALQRQNTQAFIPQLTENKAIEINILICPAFNADFDGDQMQGILAINSEEKEELREKMTPDKLSEDDQDNSNLFAIKQDLVLGFYSATMFKQKGKPKKRYESYKALEEDLDYGEITCKDTIEYSGEYSYYNQRGKLEVLHDVHLVNTAGNIYTHLSLVYGRGISKFYGSTTDFNRDIKNKVLPQDFLISVPFTVEEDGVKVVKRETGTVKYITELLDKTKHWVLNTDDKTHFNMFEENGWGKKTPDIYYKQFKNWDSLTRMHILDSLKTLGVHLAELENTSCSIEDFDCVLNRPKDLGNSIKQQSKSLDILMSAIDAKTRNYKDIESQKPKTGLIQFMQAISALNNPIAATKESNDVYTHKCLDAIKEFMEPNNNFHKIFTSGARGDFNNCINSCINGGFVKNLKDEYVSVPIESSLFNGLTSDEVFRSGFSVRNTQLSTTGKTKEGGELNRLYSFCMSSMVVTEDDCGAIPGNHQIYFDIDLDSKVSLYSHAIGKQLAPTCEAYNLIGSKKITTGVLDYLVEQHITHLDFRDGSSSEIKYTVSDLTFKQYVGRFGYTYKDSVNTIKNPTLVKLTKADIYEYIANGADHLRVRLLWDCKTETGICKHCLGQELALGTNVGIRAAQAISKTLTQLALDKKNAVIDAKSTTDTTSRMKQNILLSKTIRIDENAIYSEYEQIVKVQPISETRSIVYCNGVKDGYYVSNERILVGNNYYATKGKKLIDGVLSYGYLNNILPIEDLQLLLYKDYWDIYASNGIDINPIHFEILVTVQSGSGLVLEADKNSGIVVGSVHRKNKLENMIMQGKNIVYKPTMASFFDIVLQDGILKAVCSRDPAQMLANSVRYNMLDECKDFYSALAGGFSLHLTSERDITIGRHINVNQKPFFQRSTTESELVKDVLKKVEDNDSDEDLMALVNLKIPDTEEMDDIEKAMFEVEISDDKTNLFGK